MKVPERKVELDTPWNFGRKLIETRDLDPVYVALWEAQLDRPVLLRWLLAYWCFYHSGTASWITSHYVPRLDYGPAVFRLDERYWDAMTLAAASKEYPRGRERRHFRAANAMASVAYLRKRGIEGLFSSLINPPAQSRSRSTPAPLRTHTTSGISSFSQEVVWRVEDLTTAVQYWTGFGPWIAFKVADMLERLGITGVVYSPESLSLYKSPREGAEEMWRMFAPPDVYDRIPNGVSAWAIREILDRLGCSRASAEGFRLPTPNPSSPRSSSAAVGAGKPIVERSPTESAGLLLAPPRYERVIGPAEAETVLCKWHASLSGHYKLGEDIKGLRESLIRFAKCRLSQRLLAGGKRGGLW